MTVYIYQQDALQRLAVVEGAHWLREQELRRDSPYGFYAWLQAWQAKVAAGPDYVEEPVRSFLERDGDGAIYGEGGYSRYTVRSDGEVLLSSATTREAKRQAAVAQGIRVV